MKPTYEELENKIIQLEKELNNLKNISNEDNHLKCEEHLQTITNDDNFKQKEIENQQLKESEDRFKIYLNSISDIVFTLDTEQRHTGVYGTWVNDFGMRSEDFLGKTAGDILGENAQIHIEANNKALKGENVIYEWNASSPNKTLYFQISLSPIYSEKKIIGLIGVGRDITLLKEAQIALNESEEKFRLMIKNSNDTFVLINENGEQIFISDSTEKNTGYKAEELLGPITDVIYPEDLDNVLEAWNKVVNTKKIGKLQYRHKHKYKDFVWLEAVAQNFLDNPAIQAVVVNVRNISENKLAEAILKESEQRFRHISSTISDIAYSCITDDNGVFSINWIMGTIEEITGYSEDELIDMKCWGKLVIKEDFNTFKNKVLNLQNGNSSHCELRIKHKSGKIIWIESYAESTISVADKEKHILYGGLIDITEQKISENLIEQTRQNYETFFNTIDDFLFVLDNEGNILHTNATVQNRLGYTKEELIGKSVLNIHPEDRRNEAAKIVAEMLEGKADFCPIPILTKENTPIPVETRVIKGIWNDNPVIFGVTKDISKLKLSEEKFSKAFHSNSALMALSLFKTGTFIDVNNSFLKTLGYKKNEIIGKTAKELKIFVDENIRDVFIKILENKKIKTEPEIDLRTKTGSIISGLFTFEKIYIGKELCLITTMIDITNIKNSEKIIQQQNIELKKLNEDKDRFISIIAHDLKSPLNAILGFSELLSSNFGNYESSKVEKMIKMIYDASKRTFKLLDDTLLWAKAQSGKLPFNPVKLHISTICNEVIDNLRLTAVNKNISINDYTDDNQFINADLNMLKTILLNLISNAIKFTNAGGKVDICSQKTDIETIITISDNGIGISNENIKNIFNISNINSEPGTANEKGSGLGLLICREFIEKHNGKIWVTSQIGEGSQFCFSFPA